MSVPQRGRQTARHVVIPDKPTTPPPPPPSPAAMPARRLAAVPDPVPPMPPYRVTDVEYDPQCSIGYWNHQCPRPGCPTWVPNHRAVCAAHED